MDNFKLIDNIVNEIAKYINAIERIEHFNIIKDKARSELCRLYKENNSKTRIICLSASMVGDLFAISIVKEMENITEQEACILVEKIKMAESFDSAPNSHTDSVAFINAPFNVQICLIFAKLGRIQAIKFHRTIHRSTLIEAKADVDRILGV